MCAILKAELSSRALEHNISAVREEIGAGVKLCAVVKANAYGHGLPEVLPVLSGRVDCLAVTTAATALELRELGWKGPVLVFFRAAALAGPEDLSETLVELQRRGVTLTVTGKEDRIALQRARSEGAERFRVHLKVDTGMSRSGVRADVALAEAQRWRASSDAELCGLFTQIASADEEDLSSAHAQLESFERVVEGLPSSEALTLHSANSATTVAMSAARFDMVRTGLLLYGAYPSTSMKRPLELLPVMRLTARLLEVKTVAAGARCGYGLTHRFEKETRVGLVPIGYADGYPRSLSDRGVMKVRGRLAGVCGRVSMDSVILDLSDVPDAEVGDEVEVIGRDVSAENGIESLAELAGTIPYEIFCGLGQRVSRQLVSD